MTLRRLSWRNLTCVVLLNFASCILLWCATVDSRGLHHHHANNLRDSSSSLSMLFVPQPFGDNKAIAASLMRRTRADAAGPYLEPLASERERALEMMRYGLRMRNAKQQASAAATASPPSSGSTTVAAPLMFKSDNADAQNNAIFMARQAGMASQPNTLQSSASLREFLSDLKSKLQADSTNSGDADKASQQQAVTIMDEKNWNNLAAFDALASDDADGDAGSPQQQLPVPTVNGKNQEILSRLRDLVSSRDRPSTEDMAIFRYAIAG